MKLNREDSRDLLENFSAYYINKFLFAFSCKWLHSLPVLSRRFFYYSRGLWTLSTEHRGKHFLELFLFLLDRFWIIKEVTIKISSDFPYIQSILTCVSSIHLSSYLSLNFLIPRIIIFCIYELICNIIVKLVLVINSFIFLNFIFWGKLFFYLIYWLEFRNRLATKVEWILLISICNWWFGWLFKPTLGSDIFIWSTASIFFY